MDDENYFFELPGYENPMLGKRILGLSPIQKKWCHHTMDMVAILDFRALERCRRSVRFVDNFSSVQYIGPVNLKPLNGCSGEGGGADPPQLGAVLICA